MGGTWRDLRPFWGWDLGAGKTQDWAPQGHAHVWRKKDVPQWPVSCAKTRWRPRLFLQNRERASQVLKVVPPQSPQGLRAVARAALAGRSGAASPTCVSSISFCYLEQRLLLFLNSFIKVWFAYHEILRSSRHLFLNPDILTCETSRLVPASQGRGPRRGPVSAMR